MAGELQREVVAAGAQQLAQCFEARLDGIALPARDLRSVEANPVAELGLGDPSEEPSFAYEHSTGHIGNLLPRVAIIKRIRYVPRVASEQLSLDLTAEPAKESNGRPKSALRRVTVVPNEAASMLGVSRDFFDEHIKPELRIIRRGSKTILIPIAELEGWVDRSAARWA